MTGVMWIRRRQQIFFARDRLLSPESYASFIQKGDFTFEAICSYARTQNVMPYIVIGRLQKEKYLDYISIVITNCGINGETVHKNKVDTVLIYWE